MIEQDEIEITELSEEERVLLWRIASLERAGYGDEVVTQLALSKEVDLHLAVEIVARGCPIDTAVRILL